MNPFSDVVVLGKASVETMGTAGASRDPLKKNSCAFPSKPLTGSVCGPG